MSTNYYWHVPNVSASITMPTGESIDMVLPRDDPRWHIGLFTGKRFVWAQSPYIVVRTCDDKSDTAIVEDEYEKTYTGYEFIQFIGQYNWSTDQVGTQFS